MARPINLDPATAKQYETQFRVGGDGRCEPWHPGEDAQVTVKEVSVARDGDCFTMEATIGLTLKVEVRRLDLHRCSICKALPPLPQTYDAAWHILEHGDGRIIFPGPEGTDSADEYPVAGWHRTDDEDMICRECFAEMETAKEALRQRKAKP